LLFNINPPPHKPMKRYSIQWLGNFLCAGEIEKLLETKAGASEVYNVKTSLNDVMTHLMKVRGAIGLVVVVMPLLRRWLLWWLLWLLLMLMLIMTMMMC
jgi:hypothetical protein